MENQELQVVEKTEELQPALLEIAASSGLALTEAQAVGVKFAPFMNTVNDYAAKIAELPTENPTVEDAKNARLWRLALVSNRGSKALGATKEELKVSLLVKTRLIDSYYKVVESSSLLSEQIAEGIEKHQERIEAKRLSDLEESRIELLSQFGEVNKFVDLKNMDDETFAMYLSNECLAFNTRKENERLAEEKRIADEEQIFKDKQLKEKLIKDRTKILTDAGIAFNGDYFKAGDTVLIYYSELGNKEEGLFCKILNAGIKFVSEEKDKQDRIRKENAELKAQQEKREAEIAEQNRLAKIEQDKKDAQLKKEQEEKDRLAKIESEKQAKIQADLKAENDLVNAELKAKKDEEERLAKERLAKEKALLNAGDKEKVKEFYTEYENLINRFPNLSTEEGKAMQGRVIEALIMVKKLIISDSKTLL